MSGARFDDKAEAMETADQVPVLLHRPANVAFGLDTSSRPFGVWSERASSRRSTSMHPCVLLIEAIATWRSMGPGVPSRAARSETAIATGNPSNVLRHERDAVSYCLTAGITATRPAESWVAHVSVSHA